METLTTHTDLGYLRTIDQQGLYRPNELVAEQLGEKTLLLLVGPAAVGKSTIQKEAESWFIGRVRSFTTRPPRADDDPNLYEYLANTPETLANLRSEVEQGNLVQFATHPEAPYLYGSRIEAYRSELNSLDMLSGQVAAMRQLPAKQVLTYCIVADPESWGARIAARYPDPINEDRQKRLREAQRSLGWALTDDNIIWISNNEGEYREAARTLVTTASGTNTSYAFDGRPLAEAMITKAEELLQ